MNEKSDLSPSNATAADTAFDALRTYDAGSARGLLCPLDEAVISSLPDPKARRATESRLISVLQEKPSAAAVEYICAKLVLVGSGACVPALTDFLADPVCSTYARNALEKTPGRAAGKALRKALPKLGPAEKAGAIESLGARRDTASISTLAKYLKEPGTEVHAAAAAALGQIGTRKAAKALKACLGSASGSFRGAAADAVLVCAERLREERHHAEAKSLYEALLASAPPGHVQQAASRGLAALP